MSRVSPKKGRKISTSPVRTIVTEYTHLKHSYDYEFKERLNKVEVENAHLRT